MVQHPILACKKVEPDIYCCFMLQFARIKCHSCLWSAYICLQIPNLAHIYLIGFYEEREFALYVSAISNELKVPVRYCPHKSWTCFKAHTKCQFALISKWMLSNDKVNLSLISEYLAFTMHGYSHLTERRDNDDIFTFSMERYEHWDDANKSCIHSWSLSLCVQITRILEWFKLTLSEVLQNETIFHEALFDMFYFLTLQ